MNSAWHHLGIVVWGSPGNIGLADPAGLMFHHLPFIAGVCLVIWVLLTQRDIKHVDQDGAYGKGLTSTSHSHSSHTIWQGDQDDTDLLACTI